MTDKTVCSTDCDHPLQDMDIRLDFPDPDYAHIQFLPAPSGLNVLALADPIGLNHYLAPLGADIPYAFTIGAVTFAGMFYIRGNNGIDSYTDGVVAGVIIPTDYHIDRNRVQVNFESVGIRAHLLLDFQRKHCVAWIDTLGFRCCGYRNWGKCDTWNASDQVVIASW